MLILYNNRKVCQFMLIWFVREYIAMEQCLLNPDVRNIGWICSGCVRSEEVKLHMQKSGNGRRVQLYNAGTIHCNMFFKMQQKHM